MRILLEMTKEDLRRRAIEWEEGASKLPRISATFTFHDHENKLVLIVLRAESMEELIQAVRDQPNLILIEEES